MQFQCASFT